MLITFVCFSVLLLTGDLMNFFYLNLNLRDVNYKIWKSLENFSVIRVSGLFLNSSVFLITSCRLYPSLLIDAGFF